MRTHIHTHFLKIAAKEQRLTKEKKKVLRLGTSLACRLRKLDFAVTALPGGPTFAHPQKLPRITLMYNVAGAFIYRVEPQNNTVWKYMCGYMHACVYTPTPI